MEELGRKFAPVEEASNQLWTSMKIAILDVVGGPLAKLLNGLTEAGRLRNQINAYNGGGNGSQTHLDRVIGMLRHYSGDKQGLYNRQIAKYNSEISWREQYAKDIRAWQRGERSTALEQRIRTGQRRMGTDVLDAAEVTTQANAWREISRQYQAVAKTILNPQAPSPAGTTGGTGTTTTTKGGKTVVEEKKQEATFQQIIAGLEKEAMAATGERYDTLVRLIRLYDSAIAKEKEMRSQMHGTNEERDEFQEWGPLDEWNDQLKSLREKQSHAQHLRSTLHSESRYALHRRT
jgi:hypothetical protein